MAARLLYLTSDARILAKIREGDEAGLTELYRSSKRPVTAYVIRNGGGTDDADDMLQESLIILWERVRSGKFELSARLETFVIGTVKNLWLRRLARMRREKPGGGDPESMPDGNPSALDELVNDERSEAVGEALDALGDPCRALLLMFYWEELPMERIAERLGFANANTAKAKKYQCKKALEALLKKSIRAEN
jgi:RNA polymerase sigma factor (sigma-70 family)